MAFVIPSIFTAVDKFSAPVKNMSRNLHVFADKANAAISKQERLFRRLTPALSETSKQFLSFASSAAVASAVVAGAAFSGKSIMDYETELANLKAVTGASGKEFDVFKGKIKDVANATKTSAVDVAKAFTAIANNQPELLKNAEALAAVTQGSILLAQASKMELQPAGEALTQILNQFGKGAADAAKTVDILAAGSVAGSSEIRDTADAIQKFGTVAASAGVKIDESVALIELASRFEKGAEAGSKLRNILITMSTAKVQDPKAVKDMHRLGVNMAIVTNKALPLNDRLREMAKVAKDDAALFHIFGKENQALATGVLSNTAAFAGMLESVNTTGMAAKMAADNNKTLAKSVQQLKDKFVTWLVTSDEAAKTLDVLRRGAVFVANNLTTILTVVGLLIGVFVAWKVILVASTIAMVGYNVVLGINAALTGQSAFVTMGSTVAYGAFRATVVAATAAQWLLNVAMSMNPVGLIIIGIVALIALVVVIINKWNEWGATLTLFMGPLGMVISMVQSFRRNWDMIKKSFSEGGIIAGLKAIGATIFDALLMPMQQFFKLLSKLPSFLGGGLAQSAADGIGNFRAKIGANTTTDESGKPLDGSATPAINPKATQNAALAQTINKNTKEAITVDFKNVPKGVDISGAGNSLDNVMGKVTSTQ